MWRQRFQKMAVRGARYLTIILALTICVLIFSYIILGINLTNMSNPLQRKQARKVDKHFFFEMLPSFDHTFRSRGYEPSKTLAASQFSSVADRILISRYLSERFAYSSFVQLGCQKERVYQHLSENLMSTRLCVDEEVGTVLMTPQRFLNSTVVASRRFDMIMIEPKYLTVALADDALSHLTDGGVLIITDMNPIGTTIRVPSKECSKVDVLLALRRRLDVDIATVDVDGGISIVYARRNSAMLDLSTEVTEQYVGSLSEKNMENVNKASSQEPSATRDPKQASSAVPSEASQQASHHNDVMLNLMRFEDLHDWLAATGNVDAITAFGGDAALTAFREAERYQQRCSVYAADVTTQERALTCFQEAAAANRLCLTSRWQMAMLLIQSNKLVDAVTTLNQLQSLNPEWYKWMLSQFGAQTAQMYVKKTPGTSSDTAKEKRRSSENDILESVAHLGEKPSARHFGGAPSSKKNATASIASTVDVLTVPHAHTVAPPVPSVQTGATSGANATTSVSSPGIDATSSTSTSGAASSEASWSANSVGDTGTGLGPMGGGGGGGGRRGRRGRRGPNMRGGNRHRR